jgi:hypothetical protein
MKDFKTIKLVCEENSKISSKVVDEFLIYYAAGRNNLEKEMNQRFAAYRHITQKFQSEWTNKLKAQYIVHKIFKKDGLIKKYLSHSEIKNLKNGETKYLEQQAENPWKFSFSIIKENPSDNFYLMEDVFSSEEFLLYSPGVTATLKSQPAILWFNLIGYNGSCWQSYGPIGAYGSFEPDDIFFFATELDPQISDEIDLLSTVEDDPIPFMMLLAGANYPLIASQNDKIVHVQAEYDMDKMNTKTMTDSFITEYNKGVYRLSLKKWNEHPHFSQAYFDENKKTLLLSSMTERGFSALVEGINTYGYDFSEEPFVCVNPTMISTAADIFKKKIDLVEYEKLFSKQRTPDEKKNLDKLNVFLESVLPDLNAGREPNIEALAAKAGVDIETARDILSQIKAKFRGMDSNRKRH